MSCRAMAKWTAWVCSISTRERNSIAWEGKRKGGRKGGREGEERREGGREEGKRGKKTLDQTNI